MALSKKIIIKGEAKASYDGITFDVPVEKELGECYIKVVNIAGNKEALVFDVIFYKDKEALINKVFNFVPNLDSNFIKQAYEYLKTLPEYADAIDC
jgi:hypothetical protein